MAEVVALLKTQIDPELLKKDLENKAAAEGKEKTEGMCFHCNYIIAAVETEVFTNKIRYKTNQSQCNVMTSDSVSCGQPDPLS